MEGFFEIIFHQIKNFIKFFFSSLPWFEIFYKILNYIHELFVKSGFEALNEFLSGIQSRPVPEPHDKIILNEVTFIFCKKIQFLHKFFSVFNFWCARYQQFGFNTWKCELSSKNFKIFLYFQFFRGIYLNISLHLQNLSC